ncbi:hypothetical protein KDK_50730 [Dictyobacter kobayashii]|uniref:Uncharacterized protein n=1 Tax=Dictyobacter kobayashii TaxID=2014872 RepID=A0A402AQ36_9CHLR|nr:hypothetical protein KDK_50730 [Dictyobacter kobayashii]
MCQHEDYDLEIGPSADTMFLMKSIPLSIMTVKKCISRSVKDLSLPVIVCDLFDQIGGGDELDLLF